MNRKLIKGICARLKSEHEKNMKLPLTIPRLEDVEKIVEEYLIKDVAKIVADYSFVYICENNFQEGGPLLIGMWNKVSGNTTAAQGKLDGFIFNEYYKTPFNVNELKCNLLCRIVMYKENKLVAYGVKYGSRECSDTIYIMHNLVTGPSRICTTIDGKSTTTFF